MANQVEVPKVVQYAAIGPLANAVAVPKLVMYVLLTPGSSGPDGSNRQGHVHTQIVRRG